MNLNENMRIPTLKMNAAMILDQKRNTKSNKYGIYAKSIQYQNKNKTFMILLCN